jgi:hypothetical protein
MTRLATRRQRRQMISIQSNPLVLAVFVLNGNFVHVKDCGEKMLYFRT